MVAVGYGSNRSLYDDEYDDPDGSARKGSGSMLALKSKLLSADGSGKPEEKPPAGLCDAWQIRLLSATVIFFVTAACLHSYFRCDHTPCFMFTATSLSLWAACVTFRS
jgi:hypothetical protein